MVYAAWTQEMLRAAWTQEMMVLLRAAWTQEMPRATRAYEMPSCAACATKDYYEDQQNNKPDHQHPVWFHQHSTIVGDFSNFR